MNTLRTAFLALGSIFSLLLIVTGVVGYLLTGPAPVAWSTTPKQWNWYEARNLDDSIEELHQQIDEASIGDSVTLILIEEEVNSRLNELATGGQLPMRMRDIRVHFDEGVVKCSAIVDLVIDVQVAVEAKIGIQDGKPDITIEQFYLGRLPIPKTLTYNVIAALIDGADKRLQSLPIKLTRIVIGNGWMIISGEVKESP